MARRSSEGELLFWAFLVLMLLPAAIGAAGATARAMVVPLTLGYLGGVWRAWYRSYNGSSYYQLAAAAAPALASIAKTISRGAGNVARNELDRWLDVYDPLGLVREAIEADAIEESPVFLPVVP